MNRERERVRERLRVNGEILEDRVTIFPVCISNRSILSTTIPRGIRLRNTAEIDDLIFIEGMTTATFR